MTLVGLLNSLIRIFGDPYLRFKVRQIILRVPLNDPQKNTDGCNNHRDESLTEQSMDEETKSQLLLAIEKDSKRSDKGLSAAAGDIAVCPGREEILA